FICNNAANISITPLFRVPFNLLIRGSYADGALATNCIPLSPFNLLIRGSFAVDALAINCVPLSPFNLLIRGSFAVDALALATNCV
ncbi:hypothetical protein QAC82_14360, partial [Staphylococcus aureus]